MYVFSPGKALTTAGSGGEAGMEHKEDLYTNQEARLRFEAYRWALSLQMPAIKTE